MRCRPGRPARSRTRSAAIGCCIAGFALLIVADLVLAFGSGVTLIMLGVALWGLHMGLTQGLLSALVADTAPAHLRGTAFGVFNLVSGLAIGGERDRRRLVAMGRSRRHLPRRRRVYRGRAGGAALCASAQGEGGEKLSGATLSFFLSPLAGRGWRALKRSEARAG